MVELGLSLSCSEESATSIPTECKQPSSCYSHITALAVKRCVQWPAMDSPRSESTKSTRRIGFVTSAMAMCSRRKMLAPVCSVEAAVEPGEHQSPPPTRSVVREKQLPPLPRSIVKGEAEAAEEGEAKTQGPQSQLNSAGPGRMKSGSRSKSGVSSREKNC